MNTLRKFVTDYGHSLQATVNELWDLENVPAFYNGNSCESKLTATALQAIGKQASQVVRGEKTLAKRQKRLSTKPVVKNVVVDLDERFVSIETGTRGEFDIWITLTKLESINMRRSTSVNIPLRRTKHFNRLVSQGWVLKKGVKLDLKKNCFIFHFERPVNLRTEGETLGVDVGIVDVVADSRGHRTSDTVHPHGWTLPKVLQNLKKKKKGSKGFRRASCLRDNFVGWSVNQLSFVGVRELKLENIKNMKKGKITDRFRGSWSYPQIFDRLKRRAEEQNVSVSLVNPRNTSRTCSACCAVDAKSRLGKSFECVACGHTADADLNAALNIKRAAATPPRRGAYSSSCREIE